MRLSSDQRTACGAVILALVLVASCAKTAERTNPLDPARFTPTPSLTPTPTWSEDSGVIWRAAVGSATWIERNYHQVAAHDGRLWVISGDTDTDVWYSADGVEWTRATADWGLGPRCFGTCLTFDNKMWVIAGRAVVDSNFSYPATDVWCSIDGANWECKQNWAAFGARYYHASVVHAGKMWVIGGQGETSVTNDVWCSSNGSEWTQVTAAAAFSPRIQAACTSLNGKIWLSGGYDGAPCTDVWYSSDGANWTEATADMGHGERGEHAFVSFDGYLWITGGTGPAVTLVLRSADGVNWTECGSPQDRGYAPTVVHNHKMWMVGNRGSMTTTNDVWYSP